MRLSSSPIVRRLAHRRVQCPTKIPLTSLRDAAQAPQRSTAREGSAAAPELPKSPRERSHRTPLTPVGPPRILISNGFSRFHLAHLAAGIRQREWDFELLTGVYPVGGAAAMPRRLWPRRSYRLGRLEDRRVGIEPDRVHVGFASELVQKTGQILGSTGAVRLGVVRSAVPSVRSAT